MTHHALRKLELTLGCALLASACVLTVDSVVPESEANFDPRLVGSWEEVSGSDRAVVSPAGENGYTIAYTTEGSVGTFHARLGRVGERLVLDVWPEPGGGEIPPPYDDVLLPSHLFLAIDIGPDEIRTTALEPDSLLAALRAGQVGLSYTTSRESTAPPRDDGTVARRPGALPLTLRRHGQAGHLAPRIA